MSAPKKLDTQTETQVVAMIARGDTHQRITDWLKEDKGIEISVKTISLVKARNEQALKFMQTEILKHETTAATSILSKSRLLIDKKLNRAINVEEELAKLKKRYESEEIDWKEYYEGVNYLARTELTVSELNSLTKESFNQSQIEAGKPTSIADNPTQARANLEILLKAIASNDQEAMVKAIFPSA